MPNPLYWIYKIKTGKPRGTIPEANSFLCNILDVTHLFGIFYRQPTTRKSLKGDHLYAGNGEGGYPLSKKDN